MRATVNSASFGLYIFVRARQLTHAKKLTMKRRNFEMSTQHLEHDAEHMVVDSAVERVELSYEMGRCLNEREDLSDRPETLSSEVGVH